MPVTLKDIAQEAGVSMPVVSAVLNKKSKNSRVGEGTRKRIEEIADRLNYLPNITAQNLRTRQTQTINVVIPSFQLFETERYTQVVNGLQNYLIANDYHLQVTSLEHAFRNDRLIKSIQTDGIVLFYWGMKGYERKDHYRT
jgi:DNA-binding LacI/PurR family transcriptional regulator